MIKITIEVFESLDADVRGQIVKARIAELADDVVGEWVKGIMDSDINALFRDEPAAKSSDAQMVRKPFARKLTPAKPKAEKPARKPQSSSAASDGDVAAVVACIRGRGQIMSCEQIQAETDAAPAVVKAALARAVDAGLLTKTGKARGTMYRAAEVNGAAHAEATAP